MLYKDRSGKLWVGTQGGHLQWYDVLTKKFIRYTYLSENEEMPPDTGIRFIYEDTKGDLWVGVKAFHMALGGNGLYQINLQTEKIKHYKHQPAVPSSLSNNSVTCFYEDRKGIFWIGTHGGGLNKLDIKTGKITVYSKEDGLLSNTIQRLASDRAGNLWINADEGITRFNTTTLNTKHFGSTDGLAASSLGVESDDYNAYLNFQNTEGDIYFGSNNGNNGLIRFNPESIAENNFKPPVVITEFKIFDKIYPFIGEKLSLSYNQNFFDIEFAALSYLSSGKNKYMYKLEGIDNDWVNNGTRRIAHYTNVPPGKYTFRVKGSNYDGVWNEQGTALTIIIHPPWWQTWWAYTLYGLLIIGSIWGFIYYRSRTLIQQKRLLEKQVTERTAEVVYQKEELQTTLKDLQATQAQLIQKEKLASLGELTAGIAHEIQNPLNFVNNFSELSIDLVKDLRDEMGKSSLTAKGEIIISDKAYFDELFDDLSQNQEKINHHGKRASSIVKGMLEHSRTSTGVKELTDINKLADEYLRLSYHGLRAKDKGFNADYQTDFEENLPKIEVIPQDIGRVLLNVINNAFYAVNERAQQIRSGNFESFLNVATEQSYIPSVSVITQHINNQIIIKVKDNGIGMSEATKAKVFQPFFTTKPTGQGTGLGLSLAYDIVMKGHGGTLEMESTEGVGSEFIIRLPF